MKTDLEAGESRKASVNNVGLEYQNIQQCFVSNTTEGVSVILRMIDLVSSIYGFKMPEYSIFVAVPF